MDTEKNERLTALDASKQAAEKKVVEKKAGTNTGRETRWSARQLALMSISIALGTLLAFIAVPLIPGAPTLTYDPGNVPALFGGFVFGPVAGCIIGVLSLLLHFLLSGDNWVGPAINTFLLIGVIVPAALIYRQKRTTKHLIIGLVVGCLAAMVLVIPANYAAWYIYVGPEFVKSDFFFPFVLSSILPFNAIKLSLNAILSFGLYKSLYKLVGQ